MSKLSRFWKKLDFIRLSKESKLLFIYLFTNPDINHVGVLYPSIEVIRAELAFSIEELREATKELKDSKYLHLIKHDGIVYFVLPHYFNQIPKSQSSFERISKTLKLLPKPVVDFLNDLGINASVKVKEFIKPTVEEVTDYAISLGYNIDGSEFIDFYEQSSKSHGKTDIWVDSRGKQVRDWKAKLRNVWLRDKEKMNIPKGAPKGFETFHVVINDKKFFPDYWKDGLPVSKNMSIDIMLKKKYNEKCYERNKI